MFGEKGAGGPFIVLEHGSWGRGMALREQLALPAQVDLGLGPPARSLEACQRQGSLACARLPGAS